ncbi:hypothetical protein BJY00DRAFT_205260 [Aspergillus carlsbadensis]|nr:hypothetical protein BJY00DRAFT_205260 [Aspergillus carlsbadensis]
MPCAAGSTKPCMIRTYFIIHHSSLLGLSIYIACLGCTTYITLRILHPTMRPFSDYSTHTPASSSSSNNNNNANTSQSSSSSNKPVKQTK